MLRQRGDNVYAERNQSMDSATNIPDMDITKALMLL